VLRAREPESHEVLGNYRRQSEQSRLELGGAMNEQIARLEAEVDALHILTIHAYEKFIFLRPMLANQELHDRINKEGKADGFKRLRLWLYWSLVQELSNICSDMDARSPSIATVTQS
jgi:hypothetical protein